jgi:hypothetical protein
MKGRKQPTKGTGVGIRKQQVGEKQEEIKKKGGKEIQSVAEQINSVTLKECVYEWVSN